MGNLNTPHSPFVARREDRKKLRADAVIRNSLKVRIGGTITDISEHGCKLQLTCGDPVPGQPVTIKIDGMESWTGHIRWPKGKTVGIEFQHHLHPAVVDHLARTQPIVELA